MLSIRACYRHLVSQLVEPCCQPLAFGVVQRPRVALLLRRQRSFKKGARRKIARSPGAMRSLKLYWEHSEANHICPAPTGRGHESPALESLVCAIWGDCRAGEPPIWQPHYLRLLGGHHGSAWTNAGPVAHVEWWQGLGGQRRGVHQ